MNGITKETFQEANETTRLDILFDYQKDTHKTLQEIKGILKQHPTDCEKRFKGLERNRVKDTAMIGASGFFGGFAAMAAKLKFWG